MPTLSTTIYQRLETLRVLIINHSNKCGVDPAPSFNTIKPTDNEFELHVVVLVFVLYLTIVGRNLDSFDSLLDESGGAFGFGFSHVSLAEEELAVKIRDVNRIWQEVGKIEGVVLYEKLTHINDMDIFETRKCQVLEYFTS